MPDVITSSVVMILQLVFNLVIAIGLGWVAQRYRMIEGLKIEIRTATSALVEQRIETWSVRLTGAIDGLSRQVGHIQERIERGDTAFDAAREREQQAELKYLARVDGLKDWIRDTCATRVDLDKLCGRIHELGQQLASE